MPNISDHTESVAPMVGEDSYQQYLLAVGLYVLWAGLVWLSHTIGESHLPREAAIILLTGVIATNLLFFALAKMNDDHQISANTIMLTQCIFGIAWASLYAFLSTAADELIFGMFLSVVLFAMMNVSRTCLNQLAVFAIASYSIVMTGKFLIASDLSHLPSIALQVAVFAILTIWSLICGRYLNDLRANLIDRNEQLQSIITKMSDTSDRDQLTKTHNRHYVLENLAREKGRTDRSNQPFSICVFEIDDFDTLRSRSNSDAGDRVLKRFMKRVRTELRAMDSADALTDRLSLGRFSDDRYIIVLPQTGLYGAQRSAERIQRAVRAQPIGAGRPVTISGGFAEYQRGETIPALIDRAEQALNDAALAGGDRIKGDEKRQVGSADIIQLHRSRP